MSLLQDAVPIVVDFIKRNGITKQNVKEYAEENDMSVYEAMYDIVSDTELYNDMFDTDLDQNMIIESAIEVSDTIDFSDSELLSDLSSLGKISRKEIEMFLDFAEAQDSKDYTYLANELISINNGADALEYLVNEAKSDYELLDLIRQFWIDSYFLDTWGYGENILDNPDIWAEIYKKL